MRKALTALAVTVPVTGRTDYTAEDPAGPPEHLAR